MSNDAKTKFLQKEGLINPRPERVIHSIFQTHDFFDRLDLPQVRYEMLRIARVEGIPVTDACKLFGFSREYFYRLEREFMSRGYVSLLGSFRGRRPLIALNQEIVNFIIHRKMTKPSLTGEDLRNEIKTSYQVECSRRTVERIIERLEVGKRGNPTSSF